MAVQALPPVQQQVQHQPISLQKQATSVLTNDLLDHPWENRRDISRIFNPLDQTFPSTLRGRMLYDLRFDMSSRISPIILSIVEKIRGHSIAISLLAGGVTAFGLAQGITLMERTLLENKRPYLLAANFGITIFLVGLRVPSSFTRHLLSQLLGGFRVVPVARRGAFFGAGLSFLSSLSIIKHFAVKVAKPIITVITAKPVISFIATKLAIDSLCVALYNVGALMVVKAILFSARRIDRTARQIIHNPKPLVDRISNIALSGIRLVSKLFGRGN